ncbi:MAG TPA: carboxypeptidase-like regulatory domain-containing protein, partial [Flavobacteriales bacterium]|nr:carboxypeptidase-like regulatory domain-containing protein [Flavobacteriales bacterium]
MAQADLSGSVQDAVAGKPLAGVSVAIPELHVSTWSDSTGHFKLFVPQRGAFTVQFTLLGRESHFEEVSVVDATVLLNVRLRASQMELREVDVVGTQVSAPRTSSRQVVVMSATEMRERGALSVSDGVARLPGVTQLTTGVGISKPV